MDYQSPGFNLLTSRRPFYLLTLIRAHKNIIYTDIDAIWMKDPRPYFKGNDIDFWTQIDGVIEGSPYFEGFIPHICTGFLALKSTPKTLEMLLKWHEITSFDRLVYQEQNMLQKVAFELSVNFGVLPVRFFPYGRAYFEAMPEKERSEVVVIHNNFMIGKSKKIQRFRDFRLWAIEFQQNTKCKKEKSRNILKTHIYQCLPDDVISKERIVQVSPGYILLSEKTLFKASQENYANFRLDISKYFYDAILHWKTE